MHLSCDEYLCMPFLECPLRSPGILMNASNRKGEILYYEVLRQVRKIKLTFLVGATWDLEPDSRE